MKYKSIIYLILSLLVSIVVIFIYQFDNFRIKKVDSIDTKYIEKDSEQYLMNIDDIVNGEKYIEIDGWALEKGVINKYFNWVSGEGEAVYNNNQVVLVDDNDNVYSLNTISSPRADVIESIGDGIDYSKCGFKALAKKSKLKSNTTYKVGVILTTLEKEKILIVSEKEIEL